MAVDGGREPLFGSEWRLSWAAHFVVSLYLATHQVARAALVSNSAHVGLSLRRDGG